MAQVEAPLEISSYLILPLSLPPLPSFPTPATHYLYLHIHEPKLPTPSSTRSVFLVNVPFDSTEIYIRHLFANQLGLGGGKVESVEFEGAKSALTPAASTSARNEKTSDSKINGKKRKRPTISIEDEEKELESLAPLPSTWDRELHHSGSTAVVIFVDRASAEAALKAVRRLRKSKKTITWGEGVEGKLPRLGSERYLNHHKLQYPDKAQLQDSLNTYFTAYSALETSRARAQTRARNEPDEDGFVTVTRGGRTGPARHKEAQEKAEKQKEKNKGVEDFYRFQTREKRKERAGELVKQFEEDREKVRKMREKRGRFRPE
ncbi:MAG: Ribosomal RNA-processing protein 7 [Pycnora praestabilis]|nr:MAG: Ribosomal RNA-processing protein 7 [Pycnora praestabilis]